MGCRVVDPTLTITVSRTSLSLPALVFSGTLDSNVLGVVGYQQPALQWRLGYMPDSADVHGSEALSAAYQQAILGWDWARDGATTETQLQASRVEVAAALAQFSYTITTQISGAPAEVWRADPGSQVPSARTYVDLAHLSQVFAVTVPVYPIAS
jgi:hypothetical protein